MVTGKPGTTPAQLEEAVNAEVEKLKAAPPTPQELARAYNSREASFVYGLQTVGGFGGKSDQLNAYNVFLGDPDFFAGDLARYRAATRESVRAAARTHLAFDRRVLLSIVPRGQAALALPGSEPVVVS